MRLFQLVILVLLVTLPFAALLAPGTDAPPAVAGEAIDAASLGAVPAEYVPPAAGETPESGAATSPAAPDPAIATTRTSD